MVQQISSQELKALIDAKAEYVLVDVREKGELVHGMIPTAKNIPLSEFEKAFSMPVDKFKATYGFVPSKARKLIVYCRSGNRSQMAARFLESKGFNVVNFSGSAAEGSRHDKSVKTY